MKASARHAKDRMISGKLRSKAARGQANDKTIGIDGVNYVWHPRHDWQVWGKGIEVVSISVSLHPDRTRELILDFSVRVGPEQSSPAEKRLLAALEPAIRKAMDAGWNPESRGRAFRYEIVEEI